MPISSGAMPPLGLVAPVPCVGQVAMILLVCTLQPSPFGIFAPFTPPATLERPFLLQDLQTSLSDLISTFQHSSRETRQYLISKTCFCYVSAQVSSLFHGVCDFRNKSQDDQHVISAMPCRALPLASEHRVCYPLECRRENVK